MKHSPDYCQNRTLTDLEYNKIKFRPKVADIEKWFLVLNEQIFGNLLTPVPIVRVKKLEGAHAYYNYWPRKEKQDSELEMNTVYDNEKIFVEILAHELIHHFQHSYNEPLGHGPTFLAWRENFNLKGLNLYKAI